MLLFRTPMATDATSLSSGFLPNQSLTASLLRAPVRLSSKSFAVGNFPFLYGQHDPTSKKIETAANLANRPKTALPPGLPIFRAYFNLLKGLVEPPSLEKHGEDPLPT
jgi:hypothetical protein